GAGAGQRSAFMVEFAKALAAPIGVAPSGGPCPPVDVVTFNFLYTEQKRRIPDRGPALESCYRAVIDAVRDRLASARSALFIGGKSMGGRIATQVAAQESTTGGGPIAGLVLLGYPLHPPGRPDQRRDKHLPAIRRPMLVIQGSRDAFGLPSELEPTFDGLTPRPALHIVAGGDHSFKLPRKDPLAQGAAFDEVQRTIGEWIEQVRTSGSATRR
ncbi:MAG TPA: alpha/beta family hydrolase, partial [Vicinamibacterales bacterium]|nr:alpha/beta family hydrolase [Vicinamibacterales bacterium]